MFFGEKCWINAAWWLRPPKRFCSIRISLQYRLGLRYVSGFSPSQFSASNQRTEGVAEINDVKVRSRWRTSSPKVIGLFTACAQHDSRPNVSDWLWQIQSGTVLNFRHLPWWVNVNVSQLSRSRLYSQMKCKWNEVREFSPYCCYRVAGIIRLGIYSHVYQISE